MAEAKLVFVHGACGSKEMWKNQLTYFLSKGVDAIAVDLPGHGERKESLPPSSITIESYARCLDGFLSSMGVSEAVVCGHSMGGGIALQYALMYPEKTRGLVLVCTGATMWVNPEFMEELRRDHVEALRKFVGRYGLSKSSPPQVLEQILSQARRCSKEVAVADFQACHVFDVRERLSEIKAPTLVVVGEEDKLTPIKLSRFLHENIPNSELVVVKNAGHFPMLESPNELNKAIEKFLTKL